MKPHGNLKLESTFSERLKEAINKKRITREDLCIKLNMDKGTLSKHINGKTNPKMTTIQAFADVLNVEPLWLCGYSPITNYDIYPYYEYKINEILKNLTDPQLEQVLKMLEVMFPQYKNDTIDKT